ncbi:MAG TPA: galactose-1-epimerase, partial [Chitinophagaceae bacterium]|nr:galactose-1-epimerase [Chitinophagaceae bacterium]
MKKLFYLALPALIIVSCKNMSQKENKESEKAITPKLFYGMIGPDSVFQYSLVNNNGMLVKVLNYGGTVTDIMAPDKNGTTGDVILGYDSLQGYLQKANPYFGSLVGRYANRIANGKFILDGRTYTLDTNDHGNSLHGGFKGFDKEIWTVADFSDSSLNLVYES